MMPDDLLVCASRDGWAASGASIGRQRSATTLRLLEGLAEFESELIRAHRRGPRARHRKGRDDGPQAEACPVPNNGGALPLRCERAILEIAKSYDVIFRTSSILKGAAI